MQKMQEKRLSTEFLCLILCAGLVFGTVGIAFKVRDVAYAADELTSATVANTDDNAKNTQDVKKKKQKVSIKKAKVKKIKTQTYTGKALKPAVKVTYSGKKLKKGRDYKLTYKNNVMFDSTAKVVIKGKGKYKGTKVAKFKIKAPKWKGPVLNRYNGVVDGPSGKETYYNLYMGGCVSLMRQLGYSAKEYPYWVRSDGCKMFGKFIMVGANLNLRPKGTIVQTSRGMGMVCDTGYFYYGPRQLDIATNW